MVYGAMATQLDRVNAANASQRVAELEQEIARLQSSLQTAREIIERQNKFIENLQQPADPAPAKPLPMAQVAGRPAPNLIYKGRAATTAKRASDYYNVSPSTVIRRLQSGKMAGEQLPDSNRWIVYLDCDIPRFQKKGRKK
jgi:TolA-binding protein